MSRGLGFWEKRLKGERIFIGLFAGLLLMSCSETSLSSEQSGKSALIIIDMQYDFSPGGALATTGGDEIVEVINALQPVFDLVVATQDWHPADHGSFASNHDGKKPYEVIDLNGVQQVLWPNHAVQGSHGAQLVKQLEQDEIARVFQKGKNPAVDSYSGFFDNARLGNTGLDAYLRKEGVTEVFVVGLALDYCVKYTSLDAADLGYRTTLIVDATRAVNLQPTDGDEAISAMKSAGVRVLTSDQVPGLLAP